MDVTDPVDPAPAYDVDPDHADPLAGPLDKADTTHEAATEGTGSEPPD